MSVQERVRGFHCISTVENTLSGQRAEHLIYFIMHLAWGNVAHNKLLHCIKVVWVSMWAKAMSGYAISAVTTTKKWD